MPTKPLPQPPRKSDPRFDAWMQELWAYVTQSGRGTAVWNQADKHASIVLTDGNLRATGVAGTTWYSVRASKAIARGKWYWEVTIITASDVMIGIMTSGAALGNPGYPGYDTLGYGYYSSNGQAYTNAAGSAYGNSYAAGNVIGVAFDATAGSLYFYKDGTIQNSGTAAFTGIDGTFFPAVGCYNTGVAYANFGQRPFVYSVPDGYNSGVY